MNSFHIGINSYQTGMNSYQTGMNLYQTKSIILGWSPIAQSRKDRFKKFFHIHVPKFGPEFWVRLKHPNSRINQYQPGMNLYQIGMNLYQTGINSYRFRFSYTDTGITFNHKQHFPCLGIFFILSLNELNDVDLNYLIR